MTRTARIAFENAFYHVFNRGVNKQKLFFDDSDYLYFLKKLKELKTEKKFDHSIYSYILMPNHFHLLIQTRKIPLAKIMSSFLTSYSMHINHKYERVGVLFQNRFKSKLCDKESYFLEVSRYIHLNPIEAGIVSNLKDYPWSSYQELFSQTNNRIIDESEIEEFFNISGMNKTQYAEFLKEGIEKIGETKKEYDFDRESGGSNLFNTLMQRKFSKRKMESV